ncbi:ROS1 [Acrasis kona]|uniref:ROS1 n=1 Tax=Acrasis kona TaxID=1008807 RepID=A0AAW2ZKA8_9EUKA
MVNKRTIPKSSFLESTSTQPTPMQTRSSSAKDIAVKEELQSDSHPTPVKQELKQEENEPSPRKRRRLSVKKETKTEDEQDTKKVETTDLNKSTALAKRKLKQLNEFSGKTPFPDWEKPTAQQCEEVNSALGKMHGLPKRPKELKENDQYAACGSTPNVLNALVSTILSQNTTNANSTKAKASLDFTFGKMNWKAIAEAPTDDVADSIRSGGLAKTKAKRIQKILNSVKKQQGEYSLDYLHEKSDQEAMQELLQFDGVGPKTASCVLLFCLARESFAVDTHVFRLSKSLGWVPPNATREQTYAHLDKRIPQELKYPLHILLIRHGKTCNLCAANGKPQFDSLGECPIKQYIVQQDKPSKSKKGKKRTKKQQKEEEEEEEAEDYETEEEKDESNVDEKKQPPCLLEE